MPGKPEIRTGGQTIWQRAETESPCQKICVIHEGSGFCLGCFRRREEIAGWSALTADGRKSVLAELPLRKVRLNEALRKNRRSAGRRRAKPET